MRQGNLLLLELNEVSESLMREAASELSLKNLQHILGMEKTKTITKDTYQSNFLEPWVQWVSIHTGKPASEHRIMHLGDIPDAKYKQIWETLSDAGVTSGIWGVMNGNHRDAKLCKFFLADPWTFDAKPHPQSLQGLASLAVYIAKNYLNLQVLRMFRHAFSYGWALLNSLRIVDLYDSVLILLSGLSKFGPTNATLGAFFEYTSVCAFIKNKNSCSPNFSVLFMNILAHTQHHYWTSKRLSLQLGYAFKTVDKAVGLILQSLKPGEILLVANGFSQTNTNHERPWILYRQKDPMKFARNINLSCLRVEPLMTHDCHLFFHDRLQRDSAFELLQSATIEGKQLFWVERDENDPEKLFYRLEFTDETSSDACFEIQGQRFRFFDHFENVVTRTGKHCPAGFVYQSERIMPDSIQNHEIYDFVCKHFSINSSPTQSEPLVLLSEG